MAISEPTIPQRRRFGLFLLSAYREPRGVYPGGFESFLVAPLARSIHRCARFPRPCQTRARTKSGAEDINCQLAALAVPHHKFAEFQRDPNYIHRKVIWAFESTIRRDAIMGGQARSQIVTPSCALRLHSVLYGRGREYAGVARL